MKIYVKPSKLSGALRMPSSKSQTLRAIVFATLAEGESVVSLPLDSPDTTAMVKACEALGATIQLEADVYRIQGTGHQLKMPDDVLNAGNSGIVLRFVGAIAGLIDGYTVITGDHSIRHSRPAQPLIDGINQLGGMALSTRANGQAPLVIKGAMRPGQAVIDGADSQPVSALLIACSYLEGPTEIIVKNAGEKPWVNLTLEWLQRMGAPCEHHQFEKYWVKGRACYRGFHYTVPGDWSSAAFPIVAAYATGSQLTLENLDPYGAQGDRKIIDWLKAMGGAVDISGTTVHIDGTKELSGIDIDVNDCIDVIPALAVLGCFAKTPLRLYNGAIARRKESDRIATMTKELTKMGAKVDEFEDGLTLYPSRLTGCHALDSQRDHRVALALAAASLGAKGTSTIHHAECIVKSYPRFCESWQTLGAEVSHG